jgi:hypothetical protein
MIKWINQIGGILKNNATAAAWVAVIGVLGSTFLEIRQDNRASFREVAEEYRAETERLRAIEQRCFEFEVEMNKKLSELRGKLVMLESASQDLPFPHWLKSAGTKDMPGVMLSLNKAYEENFLLPLDKTSSDYVGKTDAQFWGDDIGSRYWARDLEVIRLGIPIESSEVDPITGAPIRVMKYPRMLGNRVIGIGGIVIPENPTE